jgi:putative transposase
MKCARRRGAALWQGNFYEHIIRDEKSLENITRYIEGNPARWGTDHENPFTIKNHIEIDCALPATTVR